MISIPSTAVKTNIGYSILFRPTPFKYSPEIICIEVIQSNKEDSDVFKFLAKKNYKNSWSGVFSHIFKKI